MSTGWTRVGVVAALAVLPCLSVSSADADECQLLDPTCVVDDVIDGEDTVDDALDVVDETVGSVTDTIEPVDDPVDDVTGDSGDPRPDGDHGGGVRPDRGGSAQRVLRPDRSDPTTTEPTMPIGEGLRSSADPPIGVTSVPSRSHPDTTDRFAAAAEGAVKSLLVVFVLLGVAVGFVVIQDRLDRGDPKLALAPLRSDMVPFE